MRVDKIFSDAYLQLEQAPELPEQGMGDPEGDIAAPVEGGDTAPPEGAPAPLTSKGEEYLLKLAYLALLFTPKEDEMIQIKNTFEASGIHDETAIRAEEPESVANTKNILVNILGTNNTTNIASRLNEIE